MREKLSSYHVVTDVFYEDVNETIGRQIMFSTRTSQALVLKESIAQQILSGQFGELTDETIDRLRDYKLLVAEDEDELATIINENKDQIEEDNLLYMVIQPTANCQLGCNYCGQEHRKHNISQALFEPLMQRIKHKFVPGKHKGLKIGWFGGEPLMALGEIRHLTKLLKAWTEEQGISYRAKIVTNGLSLKENIFVELNNSLDIKEIEVTLDGIAEFHDQRRHTKSKESTFDIIFQNLKKILFREDFFDFKCKVTIRCNVDKKNWEGVTPLIKLLHENDFHKRIAYFYPIGVYSWGNDAHLGSLTKEEFAEKEIDWLIELYQHGFKPGLLPGRVRSVCLAVSPTSEMIDAYGNVFNCTEVSYVSNYESTEYVLGNLRFGDTTFEVPRPLNDWNDRIQAGEVPCTTCKMLPVCGGACPKSWSEDMRACPPNKFNIKEKLMLSYLSTKEGFSKAIHELETQPA